MGATIDNRITAMEQAAAGVAGGLNVFYWYQIFALDSVDIKGDCYIVS